MKAIYFLLAAGIFLLPAYGESAEKKDIHAVMTAAESENTASDASADTAKAPKKGESALDEEMDDLGDESLDERDENGKIIPMPYDGENTVITDGDRDGHAAEIRPNTMAEKERDAVKKAAKKLKYKK